jgi:hypothetical protein
MRLHAGKAKMLTRRGLDRPERFALIAGAVAKLPLKAQSSRLEPSPSSCPPQTKPAWLPDCPV